MSPDKKSETTGLQKSTLIRELVGLSRFTESILRTLGSAVVVIDAEGRVVYVNPAAETLLGSPASELLQGLSDDVLVTRGGKPMIHGASTLEEASGETELLLPDGGIVTVDVRVSHHEGENGDEGGFVAILTDRTEVKRAEQISRRKERLASLGELSAGVAHEIRNPLAGIGASAQLLRARLDGQERHVRLLDVILEEVGRLDRIVESLLQFARPPEPRLVEKDPCVVLEKSIALLRDDASRAGVAIETEFEPDLPRLWIDPDQIEQVALNLLRNAIQAMEESGGILRVAARRESRRPYVRRRAGRRASDPGLPPGDTPLWDWVEIRVTDTGHGISREALDRIFDPFYTTRRRGTGLGLAISQAIIQEHGGMISLDSEPGEGTTVVVDLPVEKRRGPRRREGRGTRA